MSRDPPSAGRRKCYMSDGAKSLNAFEQRHNIHMSMSNCTELRSADVICDESERVREIDHQMVASAVCLLSMCLLYICAFGHRRILCASFEQLKMGE